MKLYTWRHTLVKDKVATNTTQSRAEITGMQPLQLRGVGRGKSCTQKGLTPGLKL